MSFKKGQRNHFSMVYKLMPPGVAAVVNSVFINVQANMAVCGR